MLEGCLARRRKGRNVPYLDGEAMSTWRDVLELKALVPCGVLPGICACARCTAGSTGTGGGKEGAGERDMGPHVACTCLAQSASASTREGPRDSRDSTKSSAVANLPESVFDRKLLSSIVRTAYGACLPAPCP